MLSQVTGLSKGKMKEVETWEEIKGKVLGFVLTFSRITSVRQNISFVNKIFLQVLEASKFNSRAKKLSPCLILLW